ncbi:MAG TPA: type II toxin-antitoxin system VapC family toxin [Ktedonobacteraceae bacterium]|nr:type II toxin-antitoxin system VapC family toxin [Ktedonobacteraceae bacterium]
MKNLVVVDANLALKWVVKEEDSGIALALLNEWNIQGIMMIAPFLLTYEVTNVLYQNMRKGKINLDQAKKILTEVLSIGIELDFSNNSALSRRAFELAHQFNLLATYDPHYVALAERENCELWTADTRLWTAVKEKLPRVRLLGEYQINQK